jgi:hypothetical protein
MADEIKWNIVGREELMGREAVIDRCDKSAKFLETISTTITKLKMNRAETFVVVEGTAQFQDQENQTSSVAIGFGSINVAWSRPTHQRVTLAVRPQNEHSSIGGERR